MTFEQCAIEALAQTDATQDVKDRTLNAARMQMRHLMVQQVEDDQVKPTIDYMVRLFKFILISEDNGKAVCELAVQQNVAKAARN